MIEPIATAPKDGREVYLEMPTRWVKGYWDDELKVWVLSRQFHLETIKSPERWAPLLPPDLPTYGLEK